MSREERMSDAAQTFIERVGGEAAGALVCDAGGEIVAVRGECATRRQPPTPSMVCVCVCVDVCGCVLFVCVCSVE